MNIIGTCLRIVMENKQALQIFTQSENSLSGSKFTMAIYMTYGQLTQ